jgi:hypothetical protein
VKKCHRSETDYGRHRLRVRQQPRVNGVRYDTWRETLQPPPRPFCDPENFSSGYIMRSQDILFKQGSGEPWTQMLEYHQERETLPNADLDDGSLVYS